MDSEYLLELKQITKYFPGVHALNGVSFGIRAGEVRAILGENGAGKSTLMNILYGYYQPSKGHLYWKGQEVKIEDSLKAQQLGISMVHQEGMLLQQMDVTSNIFLSQMDATAGFIHAKRMQQKAKKALEALGISHISPNSMVYDLSAADQKMVEIAKALSMQPRLLLLDEPTASLTEREIKMLFQTIRLLKQEGVAILYISHRLEEIFQIADSVTILRDGQHIISGDIQEFTMDSVILNMVGHSLSEQLEQLQQNRKDFSGGEVTISVEGLSKKGKFQNISFSARKGEIFGISGLVRRLLLSAKEVITSDALIFYPQKRRKRRRYGMNSYNIGLEDRKIIEEMYNAGAKPCEIAARIGKCQATIYREIKRGEVPELNARCRPAYRAEVAEKRVTEAYRKRGRRKATE